jgi:hypothetical protein
VDNYSDIVITCNQCSKKFTFTAYEQAFYKQKGYTQPLHCHECRSNRRSQYVPVCINCGETINKGSVMYCAVCLAAVKLDSELELKRVEQDLTNVNVKLADIATEKTQLVDALNSKLQALESEKVSLVCEAESKIRAVEFEGTRISDLLRQEKQTRAELEERCSTMNLELEKALKYRATLDWLEPALTEMKKRLEVLEQCQNDQSKAITGLIQRIDKTHEHDNLIQVLVRIIRPRRKSPAGSSSYQ